MILDWYSLKWPLNLSLSPLIGGARLSGGTKCFRDVKTFWWEWWWPTGWNAGGNSFCFLATLFGTLLVGLRQTREKDHDIQSTSGVALENISSILLPTVYSLFINLRLVTQGLELGEFQIILCSFFVSIAKFYFVAIFLSFLLKRIWKSALLWESYYTLLVALVVLMIVVLFRWDTLPIGSPSLVCYILRSPKHWWNLPTPVISSQNVKSFDWTYILGKNNFYP